MKNIRAFQNNLLMLCIVTLFGVLSSVHMYGVKQTKASFPATLQMIGDEAFSGTSIKSAVFHEGLLQIGTRTFGDNSLLTDVYIPKSIEFIGENAFPQNVVVHGVNGSYAQMWAEEVGMFFVEDEIWNSKAATETVHADAFLVLIYTQLPYDIELLKKLHRCKKKFIKSMRPQDRTELYPINYRFP